ncbi:unnamed protein product, partial [Polarella glacialis]
MAVGIARQFVPCLAILVFGSISAMWFTENIYLPQLKLLSDQQVTIKDLSSKLQSFRKESAEHKSKDAASHSALWERLGTLEEVLRVVDPKAAAKMISVLDKEK